MLLYGRKLGAFWRFLAGAPLPRPRVESTICRLDSVGGPSTYLQSARGVRITGARGAVGGQARRQKASAIAAARAVEGAGAPSPAAWASPAPSVGEEAARQGPSPPPWTGVSLGNPESETECCPCAAEVGTCEPGRGRPRKSSSETFTLQGSRGEGRGPPRNRVGAIVALPWGRPTAAAPCPQALGTSLAPLEKSKSRRRAALSRPRWGHVSTTGTGDFGPPPRLWVFRGEGGGERPGGQPPTFPGGDRGEGPLSDASPRQTLGTSPLLLVPPPLRNEARGRRSVFAGRWPRGVGDRSG